MRANDINQSYRTQVYNCLMSGMNVWETQKFIGISYEHVNLLFSQREIRDLQKDAKLKKIRDMEAKLFASIFMQQRKPSPINLKRIDRLQEEYCKFVL